MKEQKRHIDDFFREELGNFAETPPASAWDALEKKLDQHDPGKKRAWFSWWLLLLIPTIMGVTAAIYNWQKTNVHAIPARQQSTNANNPRATQTPVASITDAATTGVTSIPDNNTNNNTAPESTITPKENTTTPATPAQNTNEETPGQTQQTQQTPSTENTTASSNTSLAATPENDNAYSRIQVQTDDGKGGDNTRAAAQRAANKTAGANSSPYGRLNIQKAGSEYTIDPGNKDAGNAQQHTGSGMRVVASGAGAPLKSAVPMAGNALHTAPDESTLEGNDQQNTATDNAPKQTSATTAGNQSSTSTKAGKKSQLTFIQDPPAKTKQTAKTTTAPTKSAVADSKTPTQADGVTASAKAKTGNTTADNNAPKTPGKTPIAGTDQAKATRQTDQAARPATAAGKPRAASKAPVPVAASARDTAKNTSAIARSNKTAAPKAQTAKTVVAANAAPAKSPKKEEAKKTKPAKAGTADKAPETKTTTGNTITRKKAAITPEEPANTRTSNVEAARKNPRLYNPRYVDTVATNRATKARRDSMLAAKALEDSAAAAIAAVANAPKTPYRSYLSGGIKAGYEQGFKSYTAGKPVVGAYVQYHLSDKLAISLEPAVKFARTNSANAKPYGNYYDVTSMDIVKEYTGGGLADFVYTQTFDSVIVTTSAPRSYVEIEFPVTLQYKLSRHFELSGGINFVFGKLINVSPEITRLSGNTLTATISGIRDSMPTPPPPAQFSHPGSTPYTSYSYPAQSANSALRVGYMLGLNYNFDDKIALGVMVQQSIWSSNSIPNADIKSLFTQQYYRVYLGYQLFRTNKKKPVVPAQP